MRRKAFLLAVAVLLLAGVLSAACGATVASDYIPQAAAATAAPPRLTAVVAAAPTAAPLVVADAGVGAIADVPQAMRMIIKNAEMELLVADTDAAIDGVTAVAGEYGGYIISSHTWFESDYKYAGVRLGVPVGEFENVLRRLRALAVKVTNEKASGEDVTDQYVDLESKLTNLKATQSRIREFLAKAQTVEEALKVNEQLSQIEGQISQIEGQMNYLRDRSAYSTIDVQLVPQQPTPTPTPTSTPTPTPTPVAWRPGQTFISATGVLGSLLKGLANAAIWVIVVVGPFALVAGLLIWLFIRLYRRSAKPRPGPAQPPSVPTAGGD